MEHAADRLLSAVDRVGSPVCVGLDPVAERLPEVLRPSRSGLAELVAAFADFGTGVLDAVAGHVACVKIQSACYERLGPAGVALRGRMVADAHARGLEVILDAKRGDIGISAEHYAAAVFGGENGEGADWVTVHGYLGPDGIAPFLRAGRGAFCLVRTSNPGGDRVQAQRLADGRSVAESMATMVAETGRAHLGAGGFSSLGAVVGATKGDEVARLRALMPEQIILLPGFGAQGAGAEDVRAAFGSGGRGAIVTASRSVIYAFEAGEDDWQGAVAAAARSFAAEVAEVAGAGAT